MSKKPAIYDHERSEPLDPEDLADDAGDMSLDPKSPGEKLRNLGKGKKPEADDRDYSDKYNTKLSDEDEAAYSTWAKQNKREKDTYDYDMRGAWKEGAGQSDNGHFPDTHKKPNHPTFSDQSKYHGKDGNKGGQWGKNGDRDTFKPGKTNKEMFSPEERRKYFKDVEPNADLAEDE